MTIRTQRSRRWLVSVGILAAVLVMVGCGGQEQPNTPPPATIIRAEESVATATPVEAAPALTDTPAPPAVTQPESAADVPSEEYPYPYPPSVSTPAESPTPVEYPSPTLKP